MKTVFAMIGIGALLSCGARGADMQAAEPLGPEPPPAEPEQDDGSSAPVVPIVMPTPASPTPTPGPAPAPAASFAEAANGFAMDLWAKLRAQPGNLAVSPASVWIALAMTHEGARGQTADQMTRALRMPADVNAARNDAAARIGAWNTTKHPDLTLRVVNRLFGEKTYRFEKAFLGTTESRWRAPLEKVGYVQDAEAARARINGWVARETRDRIRELVPQGAIDEETRLALVNAVYFLGLWDQPFQRRFNEDQPFFVARGQGVPVTMMRHNIVSLPYAEAAGVQVLEMPYREGPYAMTVVLPRAVDGLAALEASLDAPTLAAWVAALQRRDVRVRFPKFTIDPPQSLALKPLLQALGITDAFERGSADFTGIAAPPDAADRLCISNVFHKAFVKVDEQGTEATAASSVVMMRVGAGPGPPPPPPPEFIADHPFLFFIRDTESGVVLFAGRVADPRTAP